MVVGFQIKMWSLRGIFGLLGHGQLSGGLVEDRVAMTMRDNTTLYIPGLGLSGCGA